MIFEKYKLPTHPLKAVDMKRIKDGVKNESICGEITKSGKKRLTKW